MARKPLGEKAMTPAQRQGRHWLHVTERADYVKVTAPKIEAAIAKHGLPLFLKSLAQEEENVPHRAKL